MFTKIKDKMTFFIKKVNSLLKFFKCCCSSGKNISEYSFGTHEQWVYDRGGYVSDYVYFEDGICTAIQYHDR